MSLNQTFAEPLWAQAQAYVPSTPRLLLLAFINIPVIVVALNVLYQLLPRDRSLPPLVFHWFPFIGSAPSYGQDPIGFFTKCKEKYGNVFTFILLGRRVTVALGPKGNDFVLGAKSTVLSAEDAYASLTTPIFGKDVVFDCPNELLMEQKKMVKFSLTTDMFRSYVGMIEDEVTKFMEKEDHFRVYQMNDINEWGTIDVKQVLSEITILTASRTLQGEEIRESLNKSFADVYTDLDGGFTPLHWLFEKLPLESYRKRDAAHTKLSQFYQDIIRKRRLGLSETSDHDVMSSLMQQHYRSGRALQDHEVGHIMIALLMAGQHTSAASSAWTMIHLAARPQIAEEVYQEQVKHFGNSDGTFRTMSYEDIRELPILDSVIRETLRLHPPIHSIMRKVREDYPVPPSLAAPSEDRVYVVPKGYYVMASPIISQTDPKTWKDSMKWEPIRWHDPNGFAQRAYDEYTDDAGPKVDYGFGLVSKGTESPYQPFGAGRHRCIGEQFAYIQLGTIISTIIRKLELRLNTPVPSADFTTLIPLPKKTSIMYRRRKFD